MIIPEGYTKEQVEEIIVKVCNKLAPSFKFGCHTAADMKQEAALYACRALQSGKYDPARPLENFLYIHVRNRLINFRRDKYRRTDAPCKLCYGYMDGYTGHKDGKHCERYLLWYKPNVAKQNIMSPLDICNIDDENESNTRVESSVVYESIKKESIEIIDERLPIELRAAYLQMRDGINIPKIKRDEVERTILNILGDN